MKLMITDRRRNLSDEDRQLIERRLMFAIARYNTTLERMQVVLSDLNGPKGGTDLCCRMTAKLRAGDMITVTQEEVDLPKAISLAANRMQRSLARKLEKKKS